MSYICGLLIPKHKIFLLVSIITSIGALAYFKYANFFVENFSALTGISVNALNIALPIGIRFYTFQFLSYTIDVYRGKIEPQKSIIKFGTYVALFPKLIAGPIVVDSSIEKSGRGSCRARG